MGEKNEITEEQPQLGGAAVEADWRAGLHSQHRHGQRLHGRRHG